MKDKSFRIIEGIVYGSIALLLLMLTDTAYAGGNASVNGSLNSNSGNENSNNVTVEGNSYTGTNTTLNQSNTPSMIAPQLTAGYDTCSTSTSGAISAPGFGISAGKVTRDETCERLKLAKMLHSIGLHDAAVAILAQDKRVAAAIALVYPDLAARVISNEVTMSESSSKRKNNNRPNPIR